MDTKQPVTGLENRIAELEKENLLLQEKIAFLTRKLYGRSTEQTSSLNIQGQMSLFDEAETSTDPKAAEPDSKDVASYRRRSFPGQREELLKDIPHEKKPCTLAEEDRYCLACNTPLVSVGEEFVRTEIEFIPAKVRVIASTVAWVIHQKYGLAVPLYPEYCWINKWCIYKFVLVWGNLIRFLNDRINFFPAENIRGEILWGFNQFSWVNIGMDSSQVKE